MIYLDTHVVVWICTGNQSQLSVKGRALIEKSETVLISPVVLLELQYLYEIGRLSEQGPKIFEHAQREFGLQLCERPFAEVASAACAQSWTRDPFDRIIVAQAVLGHAPLVSRDRAIRQNYRLAV